MSSDTTTSTKKRRGRRGAAADDDASAPPSSQVLLPTATSFDLLHGAFEQVRRARLIQLIVTGVALAAVVGVLAIATTAWIDGSQIEAERRNQEQQLADRQQALVAVADIGPLQRDQMQAYIDSRGSDLELVTAADLPMVELIDQLESAFPAGVTVHSLSVTSSEPSSAPAPPPDPDELAGAGDGADADGEEGGEEGAGTAPTAPSAPQPQASNHQLTITTQVSGFPVLEQLVNQTSTLAVFTSAPEVSWSGGSEGLSVTLTAQLAAGTLTSRARQIASELDASAPAESLADELMQPGDEDTSGNAPDGPQIDDTDGEG